MKFRKLDQCICGVPECFSLQNDLCQLATSPTIQDTSAFLSDHPWCHPTPMYVFFNPNDAKYKTWLWLLSFHHHLPGFREKFMSSVQVDIESATSHQPKTNPAFIVNRIHFTDALLKNRSTFGILQNVSIFSAAAARELAKMDQNNTRMIENVNTIGSLHGYAKRILPESAVAMYQQAMMKSSKCPEHHYVQAPVGPIQDARVYLAALSSRLAPGGKQSVERQVVSATPSSTRKRKAQPAAVTLSCNATDSLQPELHQQQNHQMHFIDALVNNPHSCSSPQRLVTIQEPSPVKNIATIDQCRDNIVLGFEARTPNFALSLRAYAYFHHQRDPIQLANTSLLYPCNTDNCPFNGFLTLTKKLRSDHPQLCCECLELHQKHNRNANERNKRSLDGITRMPPVTGTSALADRGTDDSKTRDSDYSWKFLSWKSIVGVNENVRALLGFVPVCPRLSEFVPVCPSLSQFVPICPNLSQFVPVCPSLSQFVPILCLGVLQFTK